MVTSQALEFCDLALNSSTSVFLSLFFCVFFCFFLTMDKSLMSQHLNKNPTYCMASSKDHTMNSSCEIYLAVAL